MRLGLVRIFSCGEQRSKGLDHRPRASEAIGARRKASLLRSQEGHCAHEIVGGDSQIQFLGHHLRCGAMQLIQLQRALPTTQVGFEVPAFSLQGHDLSGQGSEERQQEGVRSVAGLHLAHHQAPPHGGLRWQAGMAPAVVATRLTFQLSIDSILQGAARQSPGSLFGQAKQHGVSRKLLKASHSSSLSWSSYRKSVVN
jgi:hypothetical protein